MDLRGWSEVLLDDLLVNEDAEALVLMAFPVPSFATSFSCFSPIGCVELVKSSDDPGVRGVLPADPKEANAPDPRPKADEAPLVGEATLVVVNGDMPLNGLVLLLKDPSPPNLFAGWYGRDPSALLVSLAELLELEVERESLLELARHI